MVTATTRNCFVHIDAVNATLIYVYIFAVHATILKLIYRKCHKSTHTLRYSSLTAGKTPEEIRRTFGIKNDFTPDEEEQVRKENEWCEEK